MMTKNTKEHFVNPTEYCPRGYKKTTANPPKCEYGTGNNKKTTGLIYSCEYGYYLAYNQGNPYCVKQTWSTGS